MSTFSTGVIAVNTRVLTTEGEPGTVTSIARGWVTVDLGDGKTLKARLASLKLDEDELDENGNPVLDDSEWEETDEPSKDDATPIEDASGESETVRWIGVNATGEGKIFDSRETAEEWAGPEGEIEELIAEDFDDETEEEKHSSRMAHQLAGARKRYVKTKRPNGDASADCNDLVAECLRDLEPESVCELADKIKKLPGGSMYAKYKHLNRGQVRMNSGNCIRAAYKKAVVMDLDETNRIRDILGLEPMSLAEWLG